MELELGLKITKARDDITSISEFRLAKDRAGPVFQSSENNTMFILFAHLKGYRRDSIDIKISDDGSQISISGEKPIQEMLIMGSLMLKKEVEIIGFNKVFKIPDGVILDRIKAKYDEEEWILKIVMPKLVKGICGTSIEEIKEEEFYRGKSELDQREGDHILNSIGETSHEGSKENEFEEPKFETLDRDRGSVKEETSKEGFEAMMTSELDQDLADHVPSNIGAGISKEESKDSGIPEMEKIEGVEANKVIEKGEGEELKRMHMEEIRLIENDETKETKQKEIGKPKNGTKDSDQQNVQEKSVKGGFEESNNITEEFPKQVGEMLVDGSKGFKVAKAEEPEEVIKEAMAEIESLKEKVKGEESKDKFCDQLNRHKKVGEEGFDEENSRKEFPKEIAEDILFYGRKRPEFSKMGETEDAKERHAEIEEESMKKVKGKEYENIKVEADGGFKKDITREIIRKEVEEPKIQTKEKDQQCVKEEIRKGKFEARKGVKEDFFTQIIDSEASRREGPKDEKVEEAREVTEEVTKQKSKEKMGKTEDVKEAGAEIEQLVKKIKGEKHDKTLVEADGGSKKDITRETTQKEIEEPKIQTKEKDQQCLQEVRSKGTFEESKATHEEFPLQIGDTQANKRDRTKDRKGEAKDVKQEMVKKTSEENMGETEDVKEKEEIEQPAKKAGGEKYEKLQVEVEAGFSKRETNEKEARDPKNQTREKSSTGFARGDE